jgi:hyperosmotically inducible protein
MRLKSIGRIVLAVSVVSGIAAVPARAQQNATAPADRELRAAIQRKLGDLERQVQVDVKDGVVTLSGTVPSLWAKEEAVRRALAAGRVPNVASDLVIAKAENDAALAQQVGERIRTYARYSVYDNIEGRVKNGVVTLAGAVSSPEKMPEILERIAKVKGVQGINNKAEVLPASQTDDRLRVAIVNAIYRDPAFENYSRADPPIHVIVNNGHVTLVGIVRSQIERIKAESAARGVFGVLAFENKVLLANEVGRGGGR